jgi:branched-chain amino acid transport system substrate-binding protein
LSTAAALSLPALKTRLGGENGMSRKLSKPFLLILALTLTLSSTSCSSSGSTIKIGATFPLTGDNASYGEHLKNAIEIKKDEINSQGGIGGRKIEVIYQDDANDPKQSVSNLQRFVSIDHTPAVIGSAGSNCTQAMVPIANSNKTVIISPTSSAAALSEAGPYFFRTCPSDAYQGVIIAEWIKSEGYNRVGLFYVNNSWGVGMKDKFVKEFQARGGEVVAIESGEELASDFRSQLTKLQAAKPDALFMPTYAKQGGRVVKQARELGIKLPMFGADPWDVPDFREAAGSAAEGVLFTVFGQYTGNEYQQMTLEYKKRYGTDPDFIAASGYDCLLVLTEAMQRASAAGKQVTGESIRDAVAAVRVIGATGLNKFEGGDVVSKEFTRKTVKNNSIVQYQSLK